MTKFLIASVFLLLVTLTQGRRYYYPDTNDPNAIVFEGPTNYKPDTADIKDNEVIEPVDDPDYSKLIDIRAKTEKPPVEVPDAPAQECPTGFVMYGGVCFPND